MTPDPRFATTSSPVHGKYPGTVTSTADAQSRGRIEVKVPDLLGAETVWADPCTPFAGKGVGLYLVPPVGANVWVEFAAGDTLKPVWSGGFWGEAECPVPPGAEKPDPAVKLLRTEGVSVALRDADGALEIQADTRKGDKLLVLTLGPDGVLTVKTGACVVTVGGEAIELKAGSEAPLLRLDKDVVHLANRKASLDVNASDVSQKGGASTALVGENGVELAAGSAKATLANGNVALKGTTVDLNDGALEVR